MPRAVFTDYGAPVQPGAGVRGRRLECGLTQDALAERAGVTRQLVAAVEGGRNTPSVEAAMAIARALGTTVEELFASQTPPIESPVGPPATHVLIIADR